MSQLSPSPRYQSDIKFRWCPTVDCRGINNVLLVLTSVTGTQIDLLWHNNLGWYESELCTLPCGLHTAIIVLNTKVFDENWKCIAKEKHFKVDTFHIVSHKFAIELFLDSDEEICFLSDAPTLRHRYLSSDNLDYSQKELKKDANDIENFNYMYHSTPNLKCTPNKNKNDKDFDHTFNAVKFLSNQVKSLGLSINNETQEKSRNSPLFDKCVRDTLSQNKETLDSIDVKIIEYDTLSINPERDLTKSKETLLEETVFECADCSETSDEFEIEHVTDEKNENEFTREKLKNFFEIMKKDNQNSPNISMTLNKQSTIFTTFMDENKIPKEDLIDVKTDSSFTLKTLKNKPINKTIDLDDDNNFHYDSLKGEDAALHIDIKNINGSDSDDGHSESFSKKVKSNENLFFFKNSVEKLNVDKGSDTTYINYEEPIDINDDNNELIDEDLCNNDENVDELESKETHNVVYNCNTSKEYVNDFNESSNSLEDHLLDNEINGMGNYSRKNTKISSNLEDQNDIIHEGNEPYFQHYNASLVRRSESHTSDMESQVNKQVSSSQVKNQSESPEISYGKKHSNLNDKDLYENRVIDTFENAAKSLNKEFRLSYDVKKDLKQLSGSNDSTRLKNSLLPNKLNVSYSRPSNRSKFLIPPKDFSIQHSLASLQRDLYSRCSSKTRDIYNSPSKSPTLNNSNKMTFDKAQYKLNNDSLLRNRNLCTNIISRNIRNDNHMPFNTRNEIYRSSVDKTVSPKSSISRYSYSNHTILERDHQSNNDLYQKSFHGSRSRLSSFTNSNKFGGSLNNLHENPLQQTFSSRSVNELKRRKVSSLTDLRHKEKIPYKSNKYSERKYGSQKFNIYTEKEHKRYGIGIYKHLDDLDGGSGDSTESLLDEADRILNFSLR